MENEHFVGNVKQLKEMLGGNIGDEALFQLVEKVVLYRPVKAADAVVGAAVGIPEEAVKYIRAMFRNFTGGESAQKSRLSYCPINMRFSTGKVRNHEICVEKTFKPQYPGFIKR